MNRLRMALDASFSYRIQGFPKTPSPLVQYVTRWPSGRPGVKEIRVDVCTIAMSCLSSVGLQGGVLALRPCSAVQNISEDYSIRKWLLQYNWGQKCDRRLCSPHLHHLPLSISSMQAALLLPPRAGKLTQLASRPCTTPSNAFIAGRSHALLVQSSCVAHLPGNCYQRLSSSHVATMSTALQCSLQLQPPTPDGGVKQSGIWGWVGIAYGTREQGVEAIRHSGGVGRCLRCKRMVLSLAHLPGYDAGLWQPRRASSAWTCNGP